MSDVTRLLDEFHNDGRLSDELIELVYEELRRIAEGQFANEKPGQTLQATAVVHEAYLRLFSGLPRNWENRRHFFGAAAEVMRRVLVDQARRKSAAKRGGEMKRRALDTVDVPAVARSDELVQLDAALSALAAQDPEAAELVKLRYFVGMTIPEAADSLGISVRTANRLWKYSRAFLHRELRDTAPS